MTDADVHAVLCHTPCTVSFPSSFFTSPYMDPMSAPHDAQQQHAQAQKCVRAGWRGKPRDMMLAFVWRCVVKATPAQRSY